MIIGIVATLRSWKGHTYLVEAVARLQREDVLLLIVGDGPNLPNIEAAIAKHQLHQQVIFAGQQADVVPWLRAMDIFVLPSYANEGVPQGLMQAMACGLPVVSTPVGSITELVADGRNGLLVPERDAVALSERLVRLLNDVGERDSLGENALVFAREHCSFQGMLQNMAGIFQTLCAKRG
jgi:glycosyltransferase involved in cell wall biosynthesis